MDEVEEGEILKGGDVRVCKNDSVLFIYFSSIFLFYFLFYFWVLLFFSLIMNLGKGCDVTSCMTVTYVTVTYHTIIEKNIKDSRIDDVIQYSNNILALWSIYGL